MESGAREIPPTATAALIVAYNAESTLCPVLDRIPAEVLTSYDCEVLVIDDASTDGTFERGRSYGRQRPDLPLTVLRNEENQGYGGNQKVGYLYAVEEGFDFVALIHGDGQYAPEELPMLLAPLVEDQRRRGLREPDADARSRPPRWYAALQVRGEQDPQPSAERAVRGRSCRNATAGTASTASASWTDRGSTTEQQRLPLRHRDHHSSC